MAIYEKLEGPAMQAYREMYSNLKSRAVSQLKLPEEEVIMRALRPEDVGLSDPVFTFSVSSGWNTIIDTDIADSRFVGIHGILIGESGTSVVTQIKVTRMGQTKRYWHVQDVNFLESPVIYFDDPIIVDQNTKLTIEAYATGSDTDLRLTFLGAVAEKKGLLVQ
jgi:hypothetical protein